MTDKIRVLSILQVVGHPRDSKRIGMLQRAGYVVEAVAFERDYCGGRLPDCPVTRLGKIEHGHYLKRIPRMAAVLPVIRRAIRRNDIVYASGEDMAAIAVLAGLGLDKPVVLEVGDIVGLQVSSGLRGRVARAIDKILVSRCQLLILISSGFLNDYYRQRLKVHVPALVIENKLEASFVQSTIERGLRVFPQGRPLADRPMRIGYFGLLRDEWSWSVLERLASSRPEDFEIVFAGVPVEPSDLPERARRYRNMAYRGKYHSPEDLPSLYNSVDMVWIVCRQKIGLRPNRFFESCFFQRPVFARAGGDFARDIERYNIGLIIHDHAVEAVVDRICEIRAEDWLLWQDNMSRLPREVYMYTTEDDDLAQAIREIATGDLESGANGKVRDEKRSQ